MKYKWSGGVVYIKLNILRIFLGHWSPHAMPWPDLHWRSQWLEMSSGMVWLPDYIQGLLGRVLDACQNMLDHFIIVYFDRWAYGDAQEWSQVLFHLLVQMPTVNLLQEQKMTKSAR